MAVVDINAIRLVVLQQCLHDFVIFSPGDGLCLAGVSISPETPVLKFTEHLRLQHDRTPAPFGRIHARLFRCHRSLAPSLSLSLSHSLSLCLNPFKQPRLIKKRLERGWFSSSGPRCPASRRLGSGFGTLPPPWFPSKSDPDGSTPVCRGAVLSRTAAVKNVTSSHHPLRSGEGGCPTVRWAGISHLCVKRSSLKGRLKKKNPQSSLNNKEHRQKRGNKRRSQFLSTYFLTANTIFGCGLLNPFLKKKKKGAKMLTMCSYTATYPINMRHLGLFLLLTPVWMWFARAQSAFSIP